MSNDLKMVCVSCGIAEDDPNLPARINDKGEKVCRNCGYDGWVLRKVFELGCLGCGFISTNTQIEVRWGNKDGIMLCPSCGKESWTDDISEIEEMEEAGDGYNIGEDYDDPVWDDGYLIDGVGFADPGGRSALRAETKTNPRNLPCPTCKRENMLTPLDQQAGYQCDICADALEGTSFRGEY